MLEDMKAQCPSCTVSTIDISTGMNQATGYPYTTGTQDHYWMMTDAPIIPGYPSYPINTCAFAVPTTPNLGTVGQYSAISITTLLGGIALGNLTQSGCNTNNLHPYTFTRTFQICTTQPTIPISITAIYMADDWVSNCYIKGPGLNPAGQTVFAANGCNTLGLNTPPTFTINLQSGTYTLSFDVYNKWYDGVTSQTSPLYFEL